MLVDERPVVFNNTVNGLSVDRTSMLLIDKRIVKGLGVGTQCVCYPFYIGETTNDLYFPISSYNNFKLLQNFDDLRKVVKYFCKLHTEMFLSDLIYQRLNSLNRYMRYNYKNRNKIKLGDAVYFETEKATPYNFPCVVVTVIKKMI